MKILIASAYFESHLGGLELVASRLAHEFIARGHRIRWLACDATMPPTENDRLRSFPVAAFNGIERRIGLPLPLPGPGCISRAKVALRDVDVAVIHDCLYLSNIAAFWLARRRAIPVVVIQHIGLVPYRNRLLRTMMSVANRLITAPILRRANQVVFISEVVAHHFRNINYRCAPRVIFNGVDADLFKPLRNAESRTALRNSFALKQDATIALFVGRLVEKKGLHILRLMATARTDLTWVFVGEGPIDPMDWGLSNVSSFGRVDHTKLAEIYRASDVLVLPSTGEGFPLVIQEALASGLPVVCADDTADADSTARPLLATASIDEQNIDTTVNSFLFALEKALADNGPERVQQRRRLALARYSWTHAADEYLLLAALLSDSPAKETEVACETGDAAVAVHATRNDAADG